MADFKLLFRLTPQSFNLSSAFTSKSCRSSPQASMKNFSITNTKKRVRKDSISHKRKHSAGQDQISLLYITCLKESAKLSHLLSLTQAKLSYLDQTMHLKATQIQKLVKGFLVRRQNEALLIEKHKIYTFGLISSLSEFAEECYYKGKRLAKAVIKVQSTFRTFNYLVKNKEKNEKMKKFLKDFKEILKVVVNSFFVLKMRKKFVKKRLKAIRVNLAVHSISKAVALYKKSRFKNKKHVKRISFDNLMMNFAAKFTNLAAIKPKSSSSDDSSSDVDDYLESKKNSFDLKRFRPSLLGTIPVLIERKRKSQIWVEKFDEETKSQVIGLKSEENTQNLGFRKNLSIRPQFSNVTPANKHRPSVSAPENLKLF